MQKFIVLYTEPAAEMEEWMKEPAEERKEAEGKMMSEWQAWMLANKAMLNGTTAGVGKTKRITSSGIANTKNDIMLYSVIEAESHEAAAEAFKNHPHFGIPNAAIEISPINPLPGMAGK